MINIKVDSHYVFFVPPSWLFGVTVVAIEGGTVVVRDAVYIETVESSIATLSQVPMAESESALRKCISAAYAMPDSSLIASDAIFLAVPAKISFKSLVDDQARKGLRK
jgi:hypothetical protein